MSMVQKRWLLDYKLIEMSLISGIPFKYSRIRMKVFLNPTGTVYPSTKKTLISYNLLHFSQ